MSLKLELGEVVQVKLKPEPYNPYDARAIGFVCYVDEQWARIGYVVLKQSFILLNTLSIGVGADLDGMLVFESQKRADGQGMLFGLVVLYELTMCTAYYPCS